MVETLILILGIAALAIQIADSELSNTIKQFLFIDRERSLLIAASKPKTYFTFLPDWIRYTLLLPVLIFTISFCFRLVRGMVRLLDCPICLSMWMGTIFSLTYLSLPVFESILYGGVTMAITMVLDFIKWK